MTTEATQAFEERVDDVYRGTQIVAASMGAALVAYVAIVEVMCRAPLSSAPAAFFAPLRISLFVVSGVIIFTSTIVKGLMLRSAPAGAEARLARLRRVSIVSLAFTEVPVVAGLVLVMIGRTRADFYMLLAISVYMMVRHFPRRAAWDEYMARPNAGAAR